MSTNPVKSLLTLFFDIKHNTWDLLRAKSNDMKQEKANNSPKFCFDSNSSHVDNVSNFSEICLHSFFYSNVCIAGFQGQVWIGYVT